MQEQRKYHTPEQMMGDVVLDYVTRGFLDIFRNIFRLIVRVHASMVTIFFRHKFGTRGFNNATLIFGWCAFSLISAAELLFHVDRSMLTGVELPEQLDTLVFSFHLTLFLLFGLYRIWEATNNLKKNRVKRHGDGTGYSLLYPLAYRLLNPLGLIHDGTDYPRWYQLDPRKFQKWVEPTLVILLGWIFAKFGYSFYGSFIMFCGICVFLLAFEQEQVLYEQRQREWDAEISSLSMQEGDEDGADYGHRGGLVIAPTLVSSERAYRRWRQRHDSDQAPSPHPVKDSIPSQSIVSREGNA